MKKFTLLFFLLSFSLGYSQQIVLENFNGTPPTPVGFEGLASTAIVADPATGGTHGNVWQLTSQTSGQPWQGAEIIMNAYKIKLTTDKTAQVDVYSTQAFNLLAKVENGGPASAASQSYTTPNTWQTLSFNFADPKDGQSVANGEYLKLVFFPNWGTTGFNAPANFTIYVDNFKAEGTAIVADPVPTVAAPTPPWRNAADVKSIFSNAYTPIAVLNYAGVDGQPSNDNTYNTSWCGGITSLVQVQSNDVNKITGLGCEGVSFLAGRFDATTFTNFHIDIWTPTATADKSFNVKFSNWNNGGGEANAIEFSFTNASNPVLPATNPGTWISYDIPLSSWSPIVNANRNDLVQFIITSDLGTVYYDNLYLYKGTPLSTDELKMSDLSVYPNPSSNLWNIDSNYTIQQVIVYDTLGKLVKISNPDSNNVQIDASMFNNGIYLAKVQTDGGVKTIKLIKN